MKIILNILLLFAVCFLCALCANNTKKEAPEIKDEWELYGQKGACKLYRRKDTFSGGYVYWSVCSSAGYNSALIKD